MANEPIEAVCSDVDGTVSIDINGEPLSDSNPMPVDIVAGSVTIDPGDIEIGAVEIKGGTNDNRAEVDLPANITGTDLALAVHDAATAGTTTTSDDVAVTNAAADILAASATRKSAIIQNTGTANMRVSIGSTATAAHGTQLVPGQVMTLSQPYCPTERVSVIREGGSNTTASATQVV